MYCLESRKEMPASEEEIEEAMEEHISVNNSWGPKRILSENGKVTGVEFKRCTRVFDESGRFAPQYDENDTITVPADAVLVTIGQSILWGSLLAGTDAVTNRNGTLQADGFTYQTAQEDVFSGGDCCTGPKFAIDAIAAGKQAAISIHRYVHPGQSLTIGRDHREYKELDKKNAVVETYDNTPRQKPETLDSKTPAEKTFRDLRGTFTEAQVKAETARCLGCGVTLVDQYMCVGCGQCTTKCRFDAIHLVRRYDGAGVEFTEMKPVVIKQILKRKGKIAIKKVGRALGVVK
jgi:ferredoxin